MLTKGPLLFVWGVSVVSSAFGQSQDEPTLTRLPTHVWEDQKRIWTSPFHATRQDAKWWAILGGVTAGLIASDEWTSKQLANTSNQVAVGNAVSRFGQFYTLAPISAGLYAWGAKRHDDHLRETGLIAIEALMDAAIVDTALKAATQRQRPLEGTGEGGFWQGQGRAWNAGSSFPSGHAIQSWTVASVIAHEYPHPVIIPIAMYSYALGINGARFAARKHFASDIVVGAVLGWFIGDFVYAKRHTSAPDQPPSRWQRALAHVHFGGIE